VFLQSIFSTVSQGDRSGPEDDKEPEGWRSVMVTKEEFKEEVMNLAKEVGLGPKEIHIRKMKKKWTSCSSKGRLTFDTSILDLSDRERAEIVLHELIHYRYPNHGKMFNLILNTHLDKTQKEQV